MQPCPEPGCSHLNRPGAHFCEKCGRGLRDAGGPSLQPGQLMRQGAYRILEPLGAGGMGALYLAADTGAFDRRCVVKELLDYYDPGDPTEARGAQARFETEGRLLAELSHPGIPRIYSYFSEAGRHYIVMEYIEGQTLEGAITHVDSQGRTVPARPLPAEEVVRHAIRLCRVLEYLADRPTPVIHHDVKPANLIVDGTSGEVRLVDFGTAQTTYRAGTGPAGRLPPGGGGQFGTRGYAAPEQYQGLSESRSDVYSLAATVYHLLTDDDPGDHPFHFPRMGLLPGVLGEALNKALHPEVGRRSMAFDLRQALEAWLIPAEGSRPFVFRSGALAHTAVDLVALCDRHWPEARQHLADGDFDRWFRDRNRHDLVAKAKSARLEPNPDAALEGFLRRLDARLERPRLVVDPASLHFGRVTRQGTVSHRLAVRNETRGYGQASFAASVPWLRLLGAEVGCVAGSEEAVVVQLEPVTLPWRRDHQALIACTPLSGPRISIPVEVELDLTKEALRRLAAGLRTLGRRAGQGTRRGLSTWVQMFRSLLRSRVGRSILLGETLILGGVMVALWWHWQALPPLLDNWSLQSLGAAAAYYVRALPLALLALCLLSALAFVAGSVAWDLLSRLAGRIRTGR